MSDFTAFVGLPYVDRGRDYTGVDCWGLKWLAYRDLLGLELPSFHDRYMLPADRKLLAGLIAGELDAFEEIPRGEERSFDGVLMREDGQPRHIGIVTRPGRLLHIERGSTSVIESYRGGRLAPRVLGFYRFKAPKAEHE